MTLMLELTPEEEKILQRQANAQNTDLSTVIRARLFGSAESGLVQPKHPHLAAILQAWIDGDAASDPEQIRISEAETMELLRNLQANRVDLGERNVLE